MRLEPVLCNKRSHCNKKPVHCNEDQPLFATTRESLSKKQRRKTQNSHK